MAKILVSFDNAFALSTPDGEVLFELRGAKQWLAQLTLGLTLTCHSAYRGVCELKRDVLGISISDGHFNRHVGVTQKPRF